MANAERIFVVLNDTFTPPREFNKTRLILAPPVVVDEHNRNTMVTISGIPGRGYYGQVDVYFDRMDIADYVPLFEFRSPDVLTRQSVVEAMAIRYQIDIDPSDFDPFDIPVLGDGESLDMTINIAATSLQWTGSVELHLEYGKSWLDMVIGNRALDIYTIPNAVNNRKNGRMMTWGVDFSGLQFAIKPTLNGDYTDWAIIQQVARSLGIPDWIKGKLVDQATADVPDANQSFQRVVIQSTVVSGQLAGPLYFHYNPA